MSITETNFDELSARHKKELRELAHKVTALKKSVPKGDKKRKKEIQAQIAELENEVNVRHEQEKQTLEEKLASGTVPDENAETDVVIEKLKNASVSDGDAAVDMDEVEETYVLKGKKSKAKRRLQRRQEEIERIQEEAAKEAEGMVDMQKVELDAINQLIALHDLTIHEVRPDGHCLYAAFADQLNQYHGQKVTYLDLRKQTAKYMREHVDDFMPFMIHDSGDMFTEDDFQKYCDELEITAVWGGQQEILALSHVFKVPVDVYQMGQPKLRISEHYDAAPVAMSYHKHAFGLGEHYNSLRKRIS
ncbi:OTU protein [Spiromyces aspiralis]|uniref:OTU protein n=1 Tax=Spiromyces aspiralis TaxID=68401 RepID=A0ACC1HRC3_9FUNG|nr:OTU protein [Spiromyces aspiralis]